MYEGPRVLVDWLTFGFPKEENLLLQNIEWLKTSSELRAGLAVGPARWSQVMAHPWIAGKQSCRA